MKRRPGLIFYTLIDTSTAVRKVYKRDLGDVFIDQGHGSTKVLYSAHALEGSESTIAGFLHASVQAIYKGIQIFQARGLSPTVQVTDGAGRSDETESIAFRVILRLCRVHAQLGLLRTPRASLRASLRASPGRHLGVVRP